MPEQVESADRTTTVQEESSETVLAEFARLLYRVANEIPKAAEPPKKKAPAKQTRQAN